MNRDPVRLSLVMPAYDSSGRLHESIYAVREWLLSRPGRSELFLAGGPGGESCRRCEIHDGRIEEAPMATDDHDRPLARAVLGSTGEIVFMADPDSALRRHDADSLLRHVSEGWDVAMATPECSAPFADDDPAYDLRTGSRTVCFAAYRGSVARQLALRHTTQDFGTGDEHLYLLSDPELKVREETVRWPLSKSEPVSFAGILDLFRATQSSLGQTVPGWTPYPPAA